MKPGMFNALNEFFDQIYVITLERATERHENIKKDLDGLNYSFFFGADKKEFSIEDLERKGIYDSAKAKTLHRYHKPMNGGQVGCAWSHKRVHEDIVSKGFQKALILEDDVVPVEDGLRQFNNIVRELPADWELLYLDYAKNENESLASPIKKVIYHVQRKLGGLKWSHKTISNLFAKTYSTHLKRAGFHDYTDAYAVSNSGAQKLAKLQTPIAFVADNLLAHACTNQLLNGLVTVPKVFSQESQSNKNSGSYVEE